MLEGRGHDACVLTTRKRAAGQALRPCCGGRSALHLHTATKPEALDLGSEGVRSPEWSAECAQVAYLTLACVQLRAEAGLADVGPAACLAGRLALLPGLFGAPAQARARLPQLPCARPAARSAPIIGSISRGPGAPPSTLTRLRSLVIT